MCYLPSNGAHDPCRPGSRPEPEQHDGEQSQQVEGEDPAQPVDRRGKVEEGKGAVHLRLPPIDPVGPHFKGNDGERGPEDERNGMRDSIIDTKGHIAKAHGKGRGHVAGEEDEEDFTHGAPPSPGEWM